MYIFLKSTHIISFRCLSAVVCLPWLWGCQPNAILSVLSDFCGPLEPVEFPLPGGMGPYATADVVFTLPAQSSCSLSLIGRYAYTTPFQLNLVSDATHVHGSIVAEFGNRSVYKNFPRVPFSSGLNTWSFITFPDGIASFFNHQEHFRLSEAQDISFTNLSSLQMSGVTVANASLGKLNQNWNSLECRTFF